MKKILILSAILSLSLTALTANARSERNVRGSSSNQIAARLSLARVNEFLTEATGVPSEIRLQSQVSTLSIEQAKCVMREAAILSVVLNKTEHFPKDNVQLIKVYFSTDAASSSPRLDLSKDLTEISAHISMNSDECIVYDTADIVVSETNRLDKIYLEALLEQAKKDLDDTRNTFNNRLEKEKENSLAREKSYDDRRKAEALAEASIAQSKASIAQSKASIAQSQKRIAEIKAACDFAKAHHEPCGISNEINSSPSNENPTESAQ